MSIFSYFRFLNSATSLNLLAFAIAFAFIRLRYIAEREVKNYRDFHGM